MSATSKMWMMFTMWEEKVERDCSMLCSSPMSARIWRNTATRLPSPAGIIRPHMAIRVSRPMVFRATVLPPVLGPVMMRVSNSTPKVMSVGTTFSLAMRGCLAAWRAIFPSSPTWGTTAFIL